MKMPDDWIPISEDIESTRCCPKCKIPLDYDDYHGYYCSSCGYRGDGIPCKLRTVRYVKILEGEEE